MVGQTDHLPAIIVPLQKQVVNKKVRSLRGDVTQGSAMGAGAVGAGGVQGECYYDFHLKPESGTMLCTPELPLVLSQL